MRFADAVVEHLARSESWTLELRKGGKVVATQSASFRQNSDGWTADAVFGPFPRTTSWDEVVLCAASGIEDPDAGAASIPAGTLYRHTIVLTARQEE